MGKIFYMMGKSASGKDTMYKRLLDAMDLDTVLLYTTRPMREGETQGAEYHFVDETAFARMKASGKMIESRTYKTVHGPWSYFTMDDGQLQLDTRSYLMLGTLESYVRVRAYYGEERVVPLYIEVEDGLRLQRALDRERGQAEPKYGEMCRRFLADEADFSEEKLKEAGIGKRFVNKDADRCFAELAAYLLAHWVTFRRKE